MIRAGLHAFLIFISLRLIGMRTKRLAGSAIHLILLILSSFTVSAQYPSLPHSWRFLPLLEVSEPYSVSLSRGPDGTVWSHYSGLGLVQDIDGYKINVMADPDAGNIRIYEGATGSLWSYYSEGIRSFDKTLGEWRYFPIKQIERGLTLPQLSLRPAALAPHPTDSNRVYYLSSQGLEEFNASTQTSAVVIANHQYQELGKIIYVTPDYDGGLWVTFEAGVLWHPDFSNLSADSEFWTLFQAPQQNPGLQFLDYPALVDSQGRLTLTAETNTNAERIAVLLDRRSPDSPWTPIRFPNEKVRFVWPGPDGSVWAQTAYDLLEWRDGVIRLITKERLRSGQYYDVTVSPNGDFWLAAASGILVKLSPLWKTPLEHPGYQQVIFSMVYDSVEEKVLALNEMGLLIFDPQSHQADFFPAPEDLEISFHTGARMRLADSNQRVVLNDNGRIFLVELESMDWTEVRHPDNLEMDLLGGNDSGDVYVQTIESSLGQRAPAYFIEILETSSGEISRLMQSPRREFAETAQFFWRRNDHTYWLGSESGLAEYDLNTRNWNLNVVSAGEMPGGAMAFLEFSDGRIWVAGQRFISEWDQGVWKLVQGGFERPGGMQEGQDGSIWITADNGVHRYDPELNTWTVYQGEDGLNQGACWSVIQSLDSTVWVSGENGISWFDASADQVPPIAGVAGPGELIHQGLRASFSVYFNGKDAWDRSEAERLFFSYRLDSGEWSEFSSANYANFENLGAGLHSIEVRALDRNFNLSKISAPFSFEVWLPWYVDRRLIAISVLGILISLALGVIAVNRHLRLVRSYAAVEKIVEKRTQELQDANRALLHSQKMQALGSLAAGIAHDFNNILSIIKGSAQIISRNMNDSEKIEQRLGRIQNMVDQGAEIVRAMLGFSQASGGKIETFTVDEVLSDTRHLLGDRFFHQVQIDVTIEPGLPEIRGSREFLQQILLNLTFNAVDAMSGSGTIRIRAVRRTISKSQTWILPPRNLGECIEIQVEDEGSGMTPEIMARIFEPFFTTKALSNRRGAGLGLAMVYQLAEEQGYGLMVESKIGTGSRFFIWVPIPSNPDPDVPFVPRSSKGPSK